MTRTRVVIQSRLNSSRLPGKALVEAVGARAEKVDAGGVTWCVAGNRQIVDEIAERLRG